MSMVSATDPVTVIVTGRPTGPAKRRATDPVTSAGVRPGPARTLPR